MSDSEYNSKNEKITSLIIQDNISIDEQDPKKLQKYYDFVKTNFNLEGEEAIKIVNEVFLYLKLKNSGDVDPLQEDANLEQASVNISKEFQEYNV